MAAFNILSIYEKVEMKIPEYSIKFNVKEPPRHRLIMPSKWTIYPWFSLWSCHPQLYFSSHWVWRIYCHMCRLRILTITLLQLCDVQPLSPSSVHTNSINSCSVWRLHVHIQPRTILRLLWQLQTGRIQKVINRSRHTGPFFIVQPEYNICLFSIGLCGEAQ